jgi:hypothetical protein
MQILQLLLRDVIISYHLRQMTDKHMNLRLTLLQRNDTNDLTDQIYCNTEAAVAHADLL